MSDKWVVNASPLILLAKIGRIELLSQLAAQIVIPVAVVEEIKQGPVSDPARAWLANAGSALVVPDPASSQVIAAWI